MTRSPRLLALALLGLTAACTNAVDPKKIAPDIPRTVDEFCADAQGALAARAAACVGATVEWVLQNSFSIPCANWRNAVAKGLASYVENAAYDCVAEIRQASCASLFGEGGAPPSSCPVAIAGRVARGGACDDDFECGTGLYCDVVSATCPGACSAPVPVAGTCAGGKRCVDGAYCDGQGTCGPRVTVGNRCNPAGGDSGCAAGLYCKQVGTLFECAPLEPAGAACAGRDCQGGLICAVTGGTPGALTFGCVVPRQLGASCTVGRQQCVFGAYCAGPALGATGACRAEPAPSQPCGSLATFNGEVVGCLGGWCPPAAASAPTCQPFLAAKAACTFDEQCGPDGRCTLDQAGARVCFTRCSPL
jgi:hypothetical protein